MKKFLLLIVLLAVCFLYTGTSTALTYDFTTPEASILNGLSTGAVTITGIPLEIRAGLMLPATGDFFLSHGGTFLSTGLEGLGVNDADDTLAIVSQVQADSIVPGLTESIVFNFDPLFTPETITLARLFNGEDITIIADGIWFGDFEGSSDGTFTIPLPGKMSTLAITPPGILSDDSDFYVLSIQGTVVPEPTTFALLGTGLLGLFGYGWQRRQRI